MVKEWVDCPICGESHPEDYTGDCRNDKMRGRKAEGEMWADIYADLPDGAYWAIMEERGFYPEDFD